jgi:hypothetical protein
VRARFIGRTPGLVKQPNNTILEHSSEQVVQCIPVDNVLGFDWQTL